MSRTQIQPGRFAIGVLGAIAFTASGAIAQEGSQIMPQRTGTAPSTPVAPAPSQVEQLDQGALSDQGVLTPLEQSIVDEMNLARQDPDFYAELLIERRQYYNGSILEIPGKVRLITQEGPAAVDEAIAFLQEVEPRPPLVFSPGMSRAAADHAADLAPGRIGHVGSDGSVPSHRASEYGTWGGRMGENISYGSETAREFVMELIIDDGVPSRGHRDTIFDPDYAWTGVGCDQHAVYRTVCVMTYAASYEEGDRPSTASEPASTPPMQSPDAPQTTSQRPPTTSGSIPLSLPDSQFRFGR